MFTGIVQRLCAISEVVDEHALRRLTIDLGSLGNGLQVGASVAINGTCLTVTQLVDCPTPDDVSLEAPVDVSFDVSFDVIGESLDHTNLGDLIVGSLVNVERSFRVGDEIGGHILSGHISDRVQIASIDTAENEHNINFAVAAGWMKYLHHKGFVALDGASLTIASVDHKANQIGVCLIPETIERTTLGSAEVGDWINLEVDSQTQAVVDTVERMLDSPQWQARVSDA
ncbi:MAG: riboflavin synthase subunit alpha [Gammaproteobacteria bacterium]|nr:riboflavin synthase subunit alpha [Gammaproteobacteria bacterium]